MKSKWGNKTITTKNLMDCYHYKWWTQNKRGLGMYGMSDCLSDDDVLTVFLFVFLNCTFFLWLRPFVVQRGGSKIVVGGSCTLQAPSRALFNLLKNSSTVEESLE
ncbi:hypothetical protein RND81_05G152700 [Saponaria officinalis]|uniref:Uncharacterized protein n=1 Tax=Saponaria officinalis TaxID=3572 RepID=A0AAW1KXF1_SAPOF